MKFLQIQTANSLPLLYKRGCVSILILMVFIFNQGFYWADTPPDEVKKTINTVVIDAGHGGKDPGALGKMSKEKDLALAIALKLGKLIEENVEDVKVIYTRKEDVYVKLRQRAQIANDNKADLLISIHVNANKKSSPYGTSTHLMGINQTDDNLEVAIRENSVILLEEDYKTHYQGFDPQSLESYVIFSLMNNIYQKQSVDFAAKVQLQFKERAKRRDRGVKQQPLLVLSSAAMPSVLIETGFITNPEEEKFLNSKNGQEIIASAIYRAFKEYKSEIEKRSHFDAVAPSQPRTLQEALAQSDTQTQPGNEQPGAGMVFHVQIASSKSEVDTSPSAFKGYSDVQIVQDGSRFKYYVGTPMSYHDALDHCSSVKTDFPGAFVIALKQGKVIPLAEALKEINR